MTQLDKIIESDALNSTNRNSTWKYNQHINFEYFLPHEQLIFRKAFPSPKTRTFQNRFIFIQDSGEFKVLVKCGECLYSPMKLNSSPHPPSPCQGTAIQKPPVTFLSKCPDDFETQLCCGYATSDSRPKSVLLWKSTSWCIRGFLIGRTETKAEEKLHAFFLKSGAYVVTTVCCGDSMTRWQHKTGETGKGKRSSHWACSKRVGSNDNLNSPTYSVIMSLLIYLIHKWIGHTWLWAVYHFPKQNNKNL